MDNFVGFYKASFNGSDGTVPATVAGVKAGDTVIRIYPTSLTGFPDYTSSFQAVSLNDDELVQVAADYSSINFTALLLRGV